MMNKHTSLRSGGSLVERAAEIYDFRADLRAPAPDPFFEPEPEAEAEAEWEPVAEAPRPIARPAPMADIELGFDAPAEPEQEDDFFAEPAPRPAANGVAASRPAPSTAEQGRHAVPMRTAPARRLKVDRSSLREGGFIMPDAPVTGLAEEFRIIKRQLLQGASGKTGIADDKRQTILVCSAAPDEGKTFCAINLALSLASEKDLEVLLVDGDFAKPEILSVLGLKGGPGLIDAIADPSTDVESFVIQTDIERLSVLPAGRQTNNVTELLASERTRHVLGALTGANPRRIVIFDSPPALMASPASVLASKVGQVMMVVRADKTTEADLREAIGLLSGCDNVSLMLNGAGFAATGRRFGSYYGYGQ
jgi:exopolysaccharide/PEP-CTERM locus tyrosine autokinase